MKASVVLSKEAGRNKDFSPTKSDNGIHRFHHASERQLGSLRDVIGTIRRDGGTPSVDSIATELSDMHTLQHVPALLALQQTHGNRYVQRVVAGIQAKLKVGQPDDKYEQEADRVAEAVMRSSALRTRQRVGEKKSLVLTKTQSRQSSDLSDDLEDRLSRQKGLGSPLPVGTRTVMEEQFGADFRAVRIHADSDASRTARAINAEAFTYGRDIYFGAGNYNPGTFAGRRLLAHELTHVLQQTGISECCQRTVASGQPGDAYEQEADMIARLIADRAHGNASGFNHQGIQNTTVNLQLQGAGTTHSDTFCPRNSATNAGSTNFALREFRCADGTDVPVRFRGNVQELMNNLEVLRTELGNNAIRINSGYRTPAYNQSIGGATQSRHMCAQAADMSVRDHTPRQVADAIERLITARRMREGGLGRYATFTHYDVRGTRARW